MCQMRHENLYLWHAADWLGLVLQVPKGAGSTSRPDMTDPDRALWEEIATVLTVNTKMRGGTIGRVATALLPMMRDAARYRWAASDPRHMVELAGCRDKAQMDELTDKRRADQKLIDNSQR